MSDRGLTPDHRTLKTREQALHDLGRTASEVAEIARQLTPEQSARRIWHEGGPSIAELTARIEAFRRRGL